jgi:hypothetical protein
MKDMNDNSAAGGRRILSGGDSKEIDKPKPILKEIEMKIRLDTTFDKYTEAGGDTYFK